MRKRHFGALLIGLSMVFGACLAQDAQRSAGDEATQVDRSVAVSSAQTGANELEAAKLGDHTANSFVCNGTQPGLPVPISKEAQFDQCLTDCLNASNPPQTFGTCWGECCRLVTATAQLPGGCPQCFLQ